MASLAVKIGGVESVVGGWTRIVAELVIDIVNRRGVGAHSGSGLDGYVVQLTRGGRSNDEVKVRSRSNCRERQVQSLHAFLAVSELILQCCIIHCGGCGCGGSVAASDVVGGDVDEQRVTVLIDQRCVQVQYGHSQLPQTSAIIDRNCQREGR